MIKRMVWLSILKQQLQGFKQLLHKTHFQEISRKMKIINLKNGNETDYHFFLIKNYPQKHDMNMILYLKLFLKFHFRIKNSNLTNGA